MYLQLCELTVGCRATNLEGASSVRLKTVGSVISAVIRRVKTRRSRRGSSLLALVYPCELTGGRAPHPCAGEFPGEWM